MVGSCLGFFGVGVLVKGVLMNLNLFFGFNDLSLINDDIFFEFIDCFKMLIVWGNEWLIWVFN